MNYHTMQLEETYTDGSERWKCPECGREFVVSFNPYKKDVLNQGSPNASHAGGKLGLTFFSMGVNMLDDIWLDIIDGLDF